MNRSILISLVALALLPGAAQAQVPVPGGFSSDGVEFLENYPIHADAAGGVVRDGFYYITTERDLTIYDVKDPANPVQTGRLQLPNIGQPVFTEEDPETNGKILPIENDGVLMIIDVSDKSTPKVMSTLDGVSQHTISCILDCTWVYGSEGAIVDLRDPKNPKLSAKTWPQVSSNHDVTEVRPGIILTSTEPMLVLDARTDPENPTVLASTEVPGFTHATLWPHLGTDDFALVGGEATGPQCAESESATFQTYDTRGYEASRKFSLVDQFALATGVPAQGNQVDSTFCVHWFDPHPTYANGGLVPIAWYEQGVRFLQVAGDGKLSEIGWFVPFNGQSSDADWVGGKHVYVADYIRGLDILEFTGTVPQGRGNTLAPASPANNSGGAAMPTGNPNGTGKPRSGPSFDTFVKLPSAKRCAKTKTFRIKVRKTKDRVASLTLLVNGRKVATVKGKRLKKAITLKKLPKRKKFSLQVLVKTKSGYKSGGQRAYKGC